MSHYPQQSHDRCEMHARRRHVDGDVRCESLRSSSRIDCDGDSDFSDHSSPNVPPRQSDDRDRHHDVDRSPRHDYDFDHSHRHHADVDRSQSHEYNVDHSRRREYRARYEQHGGGGSSHGDVASSQRRHSGRERATSHAKSAREDCPDDSHIRHARKGGASHHGDFSDRHPYRPSNDTQNDLARSYDPPCSLDQDRTTSRGNAHEYERVSSRHQTDTNQPDGAHFTARDDYESHHESHPQEGSAHRFEHHRSTNYSIRSAPQLGSHSNHSGFTESNTYDFPTENPANKAVQHHHNENPRKSTNYSIRSAPVAHRERRRTRSGRFLRSPSYEHGQYSRASARAHTNLEPIHESRNSSSYQEFSQHVTASQASETRRTSIANDLWELCVAGRSSNIVNSQAQRINSDFYAALEAFFVEICKRAAREDHFAVSVPCVQCVFKSLRKMNLQIMPAVGTKLSESGLEVNSALCPLGHECPSKFSWEDANYDATYPGYDSQPHDGLDLPGTQYLHSTDDVGLSETWDGCEGANLAQELSHMQSKFRKRSRVSSEKADPAPLKDLFVTVSQLTASRGCSSIELPCFACLFDPWVSSSEVQELENELSLRQGIDVSLTVCNNIHCYPRYFAWAQ